MRTMLAGILVLLVLLTGAQSAEPRREDPAADDYALVVKRNIFSKTRSARSETPPATRESPPPPRPEASLVLTGIVKVDDAPGYVAFIENTRDRSTTRMQSGQAIASGRIAAVGSDWLEYECDGKTTRVEIGMSLAGGAPVLSSSGGSTATVQPSSSNDANLSIEERMRRRRLEALRGPTTQP